jgi:hypothetical protein
MQEQDKKGFFVSNVVRAGGLVNRLLFLTVCECVWLIQCIQGRGLPGSPPVLFPVPAIVRWISGWFPIRELLTGNHRLRIELRDPNVLYEVLFMISLRAGPQFPNMSCHITFSFFRSCSSMAEDNEDLPGIPKKPLTAQLDAVVISIHEDFKKNSPQLQYKYRLFPRNKKPHRVKERISRQFGIIIEWMCGMVRLSNTPSNKCT